jgi:hypothetical protein
MALSIGSLSNVTYASQVSSVTASAPQDTTPTSQVGAAATANFSKPGELMAKLAQLKESDPEKFKTVLGDISKKLDDAATKTGDSKLAELAKKFETASETGDLSGLQPQHHGGARGAGGPGGGPPPGGPGSGGPPPGGPKGGGGHGGAHHGNGAGRSALEAILGSAIDDIDDALTGSSTSSTSATTS